jgi:hypothetical protein
VEDRRHFNACVGPNQAYYADVFRALRQGRGVQLNWSAGVFGLFWFWYRKIFLWGTLFFVGLMAVAIYFGAHWIEALMLAHFTSWIFGNNIYYLHTNNLVQRCVRKHGQEQAIEVMARRGAVAGPLETVAITLCAGSVLGILWLVAKYYA